MPEDSFHETRSAMTEGGSWYSKYIVSRYYAVLSLHYSITD